MRQHTHRWLNSLLWLSLWHLFVGVGAQAPYWPKMNLSWIGSLNIISHILQISFTLPSLSVLSLWLWCPFCAPGGGHFPWLLAPAWEALPGGPRKAEGPPPHLPLLYNGSIIHYLCSRASKVSLHITNVDICNASLLCYWPLQKHLRLFFVQMTLKDTVHPLRIVAVSLEGENMEKKVASIDNLWVPSCAIEYTQQVYEWRSCWGHCLGFHVFNGCGLPAEATWYSVLSLTSSYWNKQ